MSTRVPYFTQAHFKKTFAALVILLLPSMVGAASLQLSPATGNYTVGSTVTVAISVNSSQQAFNAVSGSLKFSNDTLEVISLSKTSSVVSLWVQEPAYSNAAGNVSFEGIVLNPGYKGTNGRILNVQFRVKKAGTGTLTFSAGEILANDGVGTSILSQLGTAKYALNTVTEVIPDDSEASADTDTEVTEDNEISPVDGTDIGLSVQSLTHPPNSWSVNQTGDFTFTFGPEATAMRLLVDNKADSIPVVVYQPPLTKRTIEDLAEGLSYLHVQIRTADGWDQIQHYPLQIDTRPPEEPTVVELRESEDDNKIFAFTTYDSGSGVHHYEVRIDDGAAVTVPAPSLLTKYTASNLAIGEHKLYVRALDQAGNAAETVVDFIVSKDGVSQSFESSFALFLSTNLLIWLLLIGLFLLFIALLIYVARLKKTLISKKVTDDAIHSKHEFSER